MKVAWVTLAIIVASILGLLLINLFGDITVTNQQDYTLMKNAVEAAMYDSQDMDAFEKGICVCTNKQRNNNKFTFNDTSEYYIEDFDNTSSDCSYLESSDNIEGKYKYCEYKIGEFKINKEVFAEAFVRRFTESVRGDTEYKIDIKDISEYPPKVSVRVSSYDNYQITDSKEATFDSSDFSIVNEINGIIEYSNN